MEDSAEFDTRTIINDVLNGKDEKKKSSDQRAKEKKKEERKENRKKDTLKKADKTSVKKAEQTDEKSAVKEEHQVSADAPSFETAVKSAEKTEAQDASSMKKSSGRKETSERYNEKGGRNRGRRRQRRTDREESVSGSSEHEQARNAAPAETRTAPRKKSAVPVLTDEQIEEIKQRAETFLADVFQAMNLDAEVSSSYDRENGMLSINMKGENMGVLIGKRGQTLDSLQYLVSLVVNKGIEGYIHVKADTENYRERRKKTLENLAKNIASKVKRNRSSVALEPMNPYERRIIHSALQGDRYVTTYSEGEEPYRKVIVTMKEDR